MKTITVVADDRVGLLADISYILGKTKINIDSIGVDVAAGKAVISLTIKNAERAKAVLEQNGYRVAEANVLVLKLTDQPGELSKITATLAREGINIENVHMLSRDGKNTVIGVVVSKPRKAEKILKQYMVSRQD
ncbi:MAG TPA: ACT domain-containing protein [Candidatus Bilamarchaeaceae archaeon]|nr:ACT domain-containing protein [Candidatus Bilamarchaeaceae archaeon]